MKELALDNMPADREQLLALVKQAHEAVTNQPGEAVPSGVLGAAEPALDQSLPF